MIEILPLSAGSTIAIKFTGMVTDADFQSEMPKIEHLMSQAGCFRMLLDWAQHDGWDDAGVQDSFAMRVAHRGQCERLAVLGDEKWSDEVQLMGELAGVNDYRLFPPQALNEALDWLQEN